MKKNWRKTLDKFRYITACRGVKKVSPDIPASVKTVYRLITGETRRPSKAVQAGVERIVDMHEQGADNGNTCRIQGEGEH